ncbi:hypothetical protein BJ742DRAFT_510375 [Cladochytrium replicatum]|nr:hypothetical protein BJ742DRAFT_510375 [Cladochytrium replicatum]
MDESAAQLFAAAVENVKEALAISETSPAASQPSIASSLPDKSSTGGKYTARSAKACDRCYSRKIRCVESGSEDPLAPCKRCESAGAACTFGQPEYRRSRKKAVVESDKNAATINSVGNARYDNSFQNMEVSNSVGNSSSEGDLASHFLQLLMTQMASGGSADELKRNFGLDSIFTSNGASYPIAMPQTGTKEIMSNGLPPFLTPALQFGGSFKSDTSPEPFISFGAQPANFHGRDSSFLSLLGAGFPQTPSMQMPTPLLQSPTPVVEPPHYLLSLRQKDELIDAYFNFINPSMPFLHPGHFWNQYKGGRIPGFLLDAMFGVAVRYMNPRVKRPDSFGMSLYTLSQRDIHRSESPSFAESPNSATSELERSWSDVEYGEFVILQTHLRDRALEWFPKLRERQASISLVHTMIILSLMETSRAGHWLESDSLKTTAIEMATQLSLNVDLPGKPFEVNTRRRTWWCIVILEVNMAFGNGFETKLPVSCNPSFPEVSPEDGSATGPWSPEATRSFIATADLSRLMVKELRAADSSGNRTDEVCSMFPKKIPIDANKLCSILIFYENGKRAMLKHCSTLVLPTITY